MENLKEALKELRETHKRLADHLGISPNFLLTNYYKFGQKAIKEIEQLKNHTSTLECPHCYVKQGADLYDYSDNSDMEGEFEVSCESCEKQFTVEFELLPYINIKK